MFKSSAISKIFTSFQSLITVRIEHVNQIKVVVNCKMARQVGELTMHRRPDDRNRLVQPQYTAFHTRRIGALDIKSKPLIGQYTSMPPSCLK